MEAGVTYGVSIAIGSSDFSPSSGGVELLISGDPLLDRLSIRDSFQTSGLSLTPTDFFTAQSDGEVTLQIVNASVSELPGVFGIFGLLGVEDTSIRYDLQVEEVVGQ